MVSQKTNTKPRRILIFIFLLLSPVTPFNRSKDILKFKMNANKSEMRFYTSGNTSSLNEDIIVDNAQSKHGQIGSSFIVIVILVFLASTSLFWILWSYLDNVSTSKRCFLLYLYQDIIELALMASWFWFGYVMDCYARGNGTIVTEIDAYILAIGLVGAQLGVGILAALGCMIKFYQTKEKQLDPPLPYYVDEQTFNRAIRLLTCFAIPLALVLLSLAGIHPHLYYIFIGDSKTSSELLIGSKVLQCLVVFFYLFSVFIFALDCCYRKKESQSFGLTMERKFQCAAFLILLTPLIAFMIEQFSWKFESNILIIGELLVTVACVIAPLYVIVTSQHVRRYAQNQLSLFLSLISMPINYVRSFFGYRKRISQIVPIE